MMNGFIFLSVAIVLCLIIVVITAFMGWFADISKYGNDWIFGAWMTACIIATMFILAFLVQKGLLVI